MMKTKNNLLSGRIGKVALLVCVSIVLHFPLSSFHSIKAQKPGTTPVKISSEMQMLNGRKYYVHIVETGQTVYSIATAYKVKSYDAVTHVDIHFLHAGDTVWLPARGQFSGEEQSRETEKPKAQEQKGGEQKGKAERSKQSTPQPPSQREDEGSKKGDERPVTVPTVRQTGDVIRVSLMMPLHLGEIDDVSTTKFDVEQRGKKSYRQFEFIEFYEGVLLALEELTSTGAGTRVELNVVDVPGNDAAGVQKAFAERGVGQSDVVVALLFREAFAKAAELSREAGVYIVNPMSTRSELCEENGYVVKIQPSMESQVKAMLDNMKHERPEGHLYVIHGGSEDKNVLKEVKRQLSERGDMKYTLLNWNQSSKLTSTLKGTPNCHVLSIYDGKADQMRMYVTNVLNRLAAIKSNSPTLYTFSDWTRDYTDVDFAQLQLLNYHTFTTAWDMTNSVHVDFLRSFRERFGSEPTSVLAATGYDLAKYIVRGLSEGGSRFWTAPGEPRPGLLHPLHLGRRQAGLENDRPQLYHMEKLHFVGIEN